MIVLRDYQVTVKESLRAGFKQYQKGLVIGATGFGKTETVASIIEDAIKLDSRVIFLADRNVLVHQTSERLWKSKIRHGVLQGGNTYGRNERVLVCSQQTLETRGFMDRADLIIIDEAHTQREKMLKMLNACGQKTKIIGLTATPFSPGMDDFYDFTVSGASTVKLQRDGWLVPLKVFLGTPIDRSKLKYSGGEYTAASVAEAGKTIIGDIVADWVTGTNREFGGKVKTLCFAPTVDYGTDLSGQFAMAGYRFETVSYRQTQEENQAAIKNLRDGHCDGLISVEALVKGMDIPDVQCLIVARKYANSLASHIQMLGRGMRSCLEIQKEFCLVNDHVNNYPRFAAIAEPFLASGEWDLKMNGQKKPKPKVRDEEEKETIEDRVCPACSFILPPRTRTCPACGFTMPPRKPIDVSVKSGKMKRYNSGLSDILERHPGIDLWAVVSTISLRRKGTDVSAAERFAKAQFKNLTGSWPSWGIGLDFSGQYNPDIDLMIDAQIRAYIKRKRKNARKNYN